MTARQFAGGPFEGPVPGEAETAAGGRVARRAGHGIAVLFRFRARSRGASSPAPTHRLIAREPAKGG
ncbi:hypothetical protein OHB41_23650 [Streptomyces sp. NBC_01571]|uniref:hypothetical protein n=1 Tax=Streptomyces sp. NBC_01571 TaxID=2975883 RepID=UPI00225BBDAD|nr:hypothetical protein [Streptomyces sp. NBC_01571]MCX4576119.1 hypothetical protein [Streptomyces sp. NBC_01571]